MKAGPDTSYGTDALGGSTVVIRDAGETGRLETEGMLGGLEAEGMLGGLETEDVSTAMYGPGG